MAHFINNWFTRPDIAKPSPSLRAVHNNSTSWNRLGFKLTMVANFSQSSSLKLISHEASSNEAKIKAASASEYSRGKSVWLNKPMNSAILLESDSSISQSCSKPEAGSFKVRLRYVFALWVTCHMLGLRISCFDAFTTWHQTNGLGRLYEPSGLLTLTARPSGTGSEIARPFALSKLY